MFVCNVCNKQLRTFKGLRSHALQVHDPNFSRKNLRGSNNPHFGFKGANQYTTINWIDVPWDKIGQGTKRRLLLEEAKYKCTQCGFDKRRTDGGSILEIDHIDGNHKNNAKENLRVLCPNCHAMTPNFRNWGRSRKNGKSSTRFRKGNIGYKQRNEQLVMPS